jgi:hypothetical protein
VGASPATFNFAFRGQRIIAATLADLAAQRGLDGAAQVLFGGCSAGARGALFNLDYMQALLPPGAGLKGLIDSALWIDVTPPDAAEVSLQTQTQNVYNLVSPQARIPDACAAQYAGEEWKCLYGQYRLPFVQTPYIINAAQFDSFQMLYDLGGSAPTSRSQVAFADSFQAATVQALQAAVRSGNAVFSSTCLVHCLTADTEDFTTYNANGVSIASALNSWYFAGQTPVDISSCQGYPCVQQCPNGDTVTGISRAQASQTEIDNGSTDNPAAAPVGSEVNGVFVYRMQGMGFGGGAASGGSGAPGGQGYVPSGGGQQAWQAPSNQDATVSWMSLGRRLLRDRA